MSRQLDGTGVVKKWHGAGSCRSATKRISALSVSAAGVGPAEVEEESRARRGCVRERRADALVALQSKHGLIRKQGRERSSGKGGEDREVGTTAAATLARAMTGLSRRTNPSANCMKAPVVLSQNKSQQVLVNVSTPSVRNRTSFWHS